jgi:hypothetical protein
MSAHCGTCGTDLVYPEGTWPLGTCQVCDLREQLRERDVLLADAKDALDMCHTGMGNIVCSRGGIGCSVDHDYLAPLLARIEELEGKA